MVDILSLSIDASPNALRPLRDAAAVELSHRGIADLDADLIVCLLNELVTLAFAAATGRLRVTLDVDMDLARIAVIDDGVPPDVRPRFGHPSAMPWFAFIDALADSWGMSTHCGSTYLWAERPIAAASDSRDEAAGV